MGIVDDDAPFLGVITTLLVPAELHWPSTNHSAARSSNHAHLESRNHGASL
jgi:hypothetical protein